MSIFDHITNEMLVNEFVKRAHDDNDKLRKALSWATEIIIKDVKEFHKHQTAKDIREEFKMPMINHYGDG